MFFFKIFGKFIGILLIIIGAATIIGMFVGMLTVGTLDWFHLPGVDGVLNSITGTPVWVLSLLLFFTIGIPFFFLLYLGLKILVNNLKSIGNIAKFSLLGLWLISLISLIVMGVREAASHAFTGSVTTENEFFLENQSDTLNIQLASTELWDQREYMRMDDAVMIYDNEGNPVLLSDDVRFNLKKSQDSIIKISVRQEANGPSYDEARGTAEKIEYSYVMNGNNLLLNDFLTTSDKSRFNDQEVRVNLYLPVGTILKYTPSSSRNWVVRAETDRGDIDLENSIWKMGFDGELKCQECPEEIMDEDEENRFRINADGIDININDEDGESFKMKIDEDGVRIKAKDDEDDVDINIDNNGNKVEIKAKDGDTTMKKPLLKTRTTVQ